MLVKSVGPLSIYMIAYVYLILLAFIFPTRTIVYLHVSDYGP